MTAAEPIVMTGTIHCQRSDLLVATLPTTKAFSLAPASAIASDSALLAFHVSYGPAANPFLDALMTAAAPIGITGRVRAGATLHAIPPLPPTAQVSQFMLTMPTPKTFSLARASAIATGIAPLASLVSNGLAAASIGITTIHLVATMATPQTL